LRLPAFAPGNATREVRTVSSILHPPLMDQVGLAPACDRMQSYSPNAADLLAIFASPKI
jgi:hypothetical protein